MRNTLNIALADLRIYLSSVSNLVALTAMPIILTVLLGGATTTQGGPSRLRIDVLDQDQTAASESFIATLREVNASLVLCPLDQDDENICRIDDGVERSVETSQQRIEDGITAALLVIPAGYGEAIASAQSVSLPYYSQASMTTGDPVLQSIQAVLQRVNGVSVAAQMGLAFVDTLADSLDTDVLADDDIREAYRQDVSEAAEARWDSPPAGVQYELSREGIQDDTSIPSGFNQSVPGMAVMFVMFTVFGAIGLLLEERKEWTLQRLVVMPVTRAQIIGGKILSRFTLGMIQFGIVFAVGLVLGVDFGNNPLALLLVMASYTLCITSLAFAISPLIQTEGQANSLATMLSLILAALGGAWWSLNLPFIPEFMRVAGYLTPVAWGMDGLNALIFYDGGLAEVLLPSVVLLVASAVLFVIGVRNFRYE